MFLFVIFDRRKRAPDTTLAAGTIMPETSFPSEMLKIPPEFVN